MYGYLDAVRQRVWVDTDFDSDANGNNDRIVVDIMRPAATEQGLTVPVIMTVSPYYSTAGRGNEAEKKIDDANGLLAQWPLFLDNYFVPRGYAIALVDMTGTSRSTGCPTVQGSTDTSAGIEVIDWLNGRRTARDKVGNPVSAYWHNGKTGVIGKSYDGALAFAASVTGVQGLTTVVAESGHYSHYDYARSNGVVQQGNHFMASQANGVTNPNHRAHCQQVRDNLSANDGDDTGDYSPFWDERNNTKDADAVTASVFLVHGLQDDNVRPDHFSKLWYRLSALNVPRKAWLMQVGHVEPFDARRTVWVDTLHRWFDYWLWDVPNGIMSEPQVDIETGPGAWETAAGWPIPGATPTQVFLGPGDDAGVLGLTPAPGDELTSTFTDSSTQTESTMIASPTTVTQNRRVFLSPALTSPLRISGTPLVQLNGSASQPDTNLGAILVDYGPAFPHVSRNSNGINTLATSDCWGESSPADSACYKQVVEVTDFGITPWRVSKGILDALNRPSLTTPEQLTTDQRYDFSFPLIPHDYTFPAGHWIGVVIVGSYPGYPSIADTTGADITLSLQTSRVVLPIVGGYSAALAAGLAGTEGTTTALSQDEEPTEVDEPVTFTATVAAQDAAMATATLPSFVSEALPADVAAGFAILGTPRGTVQFNVDGTPLGAPFALDEAGSAQLTTSTLACGTHSVAADYSGLEEFAASTSPTLTHTVNCPTAVGLLSSTARHTRRGVLVRWTTASEIDVVAFRVYRELHGRRILAGKLVPARGTRGSPYSFLDSKAPRSTKRLRYWVKQIAVSGRTTWYGPIRVAARD